MAILVVGPAASLLGMRHQERADRVFAGVRNIWYGGETWAFCGLVRAWAVDMARRRLQGFGCAARVLGRDGFCRQEMISGDGGESDPKTLWRGVGAVGWSMS